MKLAGQLEVTVFSNALRKLYAPATAASFPSRVAAALGAIMANCAVTVDDVEIDRRYPKKQDPPVALSQTHDSAERTNRLRLSHVGDWVMLREFRTGSIGSAPKRRSVKDHISIILPGRDRIIHLTFRVHGSFSKDELRRLELLSPHIAQAFANVEGRRAKDQSRQKRITRERRDVGLTPRETEVLRWVAGGKRNREIGLILNTSGRTIQKQVQSILEKLSVETRGGAAAWWFEHGGRVT